MRRLLVFALAFLAGCGSSTPPAAPSAQTTPVVQTPRVVVISVDGLRPDALSQTSAPFMRGIAERGAYSWTAQTISPSNTLPSHISMLSGYSPSVHKITWDDYLPQRGSITVPTIFTATRAAGFRSVMVVGKEKFKYFQDTGFVDTYIYAAGGDDDVANQAIVQASTAFDFMFVHFPNVDIVGHARGWMSASYLAQVTATDWTIGRFLTALPQGTTVLLTADHGGHGTGHGTSSSEDMTIPWMISGPKVVPGPLTTKIVTMDTAATAAYVLSLHLPADVTGKAVLEAFQPRASHARREGTPAD